MRRKLLTIILWLIALGWAAFCLFLSWQPGEDTGAFSMRIAQFLLGVLSRFGMEPDPMAFHMGLRLSAHFAVFFVSGLLFAAALGVSLPRDGRWNGLAFLAAALICSVTAVLAEVAKLKIPGRHLQWDEAMLNVAGVVCGTLIVWGVFALSAAHRRRKR